MKILMINDCAYVAQSLCDAINRYTQSKHSAHHIFTPRKKEVSLLSHILSYLSFCLKLRKISKNYDFIIIHYARHGLLSLFCKSSVIIFCHGTDVRNLQTLPLHIRIFVKIGLSRAVKIFYSTPDLKADLVDYEKKSFWMPSSIEQDGNFQNIENNRNNEGTIMFISKLGTSKGMENIPDMLSLLIKDDRVKKIKIVNFILDLKQIKIANHSKIEKLPLMSKNAFMQQISQADIVVGQLSPFGIFAVSELDAMCCKKPLVSRFTFDDCYATPPPFNRANDVASLMKEINKLLSQSLGERRRLGEKNYQWFKEYHSQEVVCQQFISHLIN